MNPRRGTHENAGRRRSSVEKTTAAHHRDAGQIGEVELCAEQNRQTVRKPHDAATTRRRKRGLKRHTVIG